LDTGFLSPPYPSAVSCVVVGNMAEAGRGERRICILQRTTP
jgi:hypothetical protein